MPQASASLRLLTMPAWQAADRALSRTLVIQATWPVVSSPRWSGLALAGGRAASARAYWRGPPPRPDPQPPPPPPRTAARTEGAGGPPPAGGGRPAAPRGGG